jgi:hypothetical protein
MQASDQIKAIVKRFFRGVYYILTLQWQKALDLASGKDV